MKRLIVWLANKRILNNIVFNNLLIALHLDHWFAHYINTYNYQNDHDPDNTKTLQEIAGYSQTQDMNELLASIHEELVKVRDVELNEGARILDIGCGPGLFLKNFGSEYQKVGIDITPGMIEYAKKEVPDATFIVGDFIEDDIEGKFDLIFSVGTLMYLSKSTMKKFRKKVDSLLKQGGIVFLSYPHAISKKDLYYPDLTYNQYSPKYLEKLFQQGYKLESHFRSVDKKVLGKYDEDPFVNPRNPNYKTYQNSSIIILRKL